MRFIICLSLFIPFASFGQQKSKVYGQVGVTTFLSKSYGNRFGPSAGGGLGFGKTSIGAGFDFFTFEKNEAKFVQSYLDLRLYLEGFNNPSTPFIAVQPGWVIHNKTVGGFTTKGRFAFNAMLGFMGRFKKTGGVIISAGFSTISFRNNFTTTPNNTYNGAKISAGFIF